jgi:hypothetical protein
LHVAWLAYEFQSPAFSKHILIKTGGSVLPPFQNKPDGSSPCFYIDGYKKDLLDAVTDVHIIATINHSNL